MSDFTFDERGMGGGAEGGGAPRRPNANLGSAEAEEIFMAFDTRIVRRFWGFVRPQGWLLTAFRR